MTAQDWHDVADLCELGASNADLTDAIENPHGGTHTRTSKTKAAEWMRKLAMKATRTAMTIEEKGKP